MIVIIYEVIRNEGLLGSSFFGLDFFLFVLLSISQFCGTLEIELNDLMTSFNHVEMKY